MSGGRLPLSIAIGDYVHVRPLIDGRVRTAGMDIAWVQIQNEQILQRAFRHREWDAFEFSLAQYVALRSSGHNDLVAIPVFPSRVFRHGSVFVRPGRTLEPRDLVGGRIGVPEWVQTAGVWARGILADEFGVHANNVEWVQGGLLQAGREEHVEVGLPDGVVVRRERQRSLTELLDAGELDAVMSARAPGRLDGDVEPVRLLPDYRARELEWGIRNHVIPIMHVLVIRRDVYDRDRWIARGLLDAFDEARRVSVEALADLTTSIVPMPWVGDDIQALSELFPGEWWAYGVEANRHPLEMFLRYAATQGIARPALSIEDLFPVETLTGTVI